LNIKSLSELLSGKSQKTKMIILLVLGALGLVLVAFPLLFNSDSIDSTTKTEKQQQQDAQVYKEDLEQRLTDILTNVDGVGQVKVMVTLDGENSKSIAYNETTSGSSSTDNTSRSSEQTTVSKDAVLVKEGTETSPYTLEDKYPQVLGVVVVADGAQNVYVKSYITNAVKTALNISAHKVVVLPMENNKGE